MTAYFVHPQALVESVNIGDGTRVWAFAHVLPGARIGRDCNICDGVFVENDVIVGDRVTVKCGVQLWDGVRLGDDVFVGPNATFTNDRFPRSKQYSTPFQQTIVGPGASIGANATLLPGISIGSEAMVGAGAVVTRDVPPRTIVVGNPARISGYVEAPAASGSTTEAGKAERRALRVDGAALHELPEVRDLRGALIFGEIDLQLPFTPHRFFLIFDVPNARVRGEHAHRTLHEFLVCLRGSCSVVLDDGVNRDEVRLESPRLGLHIPPQTWRVHYKYSPDALLLVLASHPYDPGDYIRDYQTFKRQVARPAS
jgi:acetyltransferase-like isoleucine patch superfamily enzyme/dTDP-4-dehydrorhamnose 3,5-epimerase-like enzyme